MMNSRYDNFNLRELILSLKNQFADLTTVYLFGSRRHRTRSARSDVDLLVAFDEHISPEDLREFALQICPALDFFVIDNGVAISCANNSKVSAKDTKQLVKKLDALEIWNQSVGFLDADVDWEIYVIKGHVPMMTSLHTAAPYPSKANMILPNTDNSSSEGPRQIENICSKLKNLIKNHPIFPLLSVASAIVYGTWMIAEKTRIDPLKERIEALEKDLDRKQSREDLIPKVTEKSSQNSRRAKASIAMVEDQTVDLGNTIPFTAKISNGQNSLAVPTLKQLFQEQERRTTIKLDTSLDLSMTEKEKIEILFSIFVDHELGAKFVSFYVPPSRYSFPACEYLLKNTRYAILEKEINEPPISSKEIPFSGRVLLYVDSYFSHAELAELENIYKRGNLLVSIRGRDYLQLELVRRSAKR